MQAVIRETTYDSKLPFFETREFREFQQAHAKQPGYLGSTVTDVGDGRYVTVTFWATAEDMNKARKVLGPLISRLLTPLMSAPTKVYGIGPVVINDLVSYDRDSR